MLNARFTVERSVSLPSGFHLSRDACRYVQNLASTTSEKPKEQEKERESNLFQSYSEIGFGIIFLRKAMPHPFLVVMNLLVRALCARIVGGSEEAGDPTSSGNTWRRPSAGMGSASRPR